MSNGMTQHHSAVLVIGAGGFGCTLAEAAEDAGLEIIGFVDDRWPELTEAWQRPVLGRVDDMVRLRHQSGAVLLAIGHNPTRAAVAERARTAGMELLSFVHPRAVVARSATLEAGSLVMAGACIGSHAHVGQGALVNMGAILDHHVHLGNFSHIGLGACVGGGASVDDGAFLKAGEVLPPGARCAYES